MSPISLLTLSLLAQSPANTLANPMSSADPMKWLVPLALGFGTLIIPYFLGFPLANYFKLKTHGWRIGLILSTLACSLAMIAFYWPPKLGVDLKGGYNLVYQFDKEKLKVLATLGDELYRKAKTIEILKSRLNPDGLKEIIIRGYGDDAIEFVIPETNREQVEAMKRAITSTGFMEFMIVAERGLDSEIEVAIEEAKTRPNGKIKLVRSGDEPVAAWKKLGLDVEAQQNAEGLSPFKVTVQPSYVLRDGTTGKILDATMYDTKDPLDLERRLKKLGVTDPEILMLYNANPEERVEGGDLWRTRSDRDEFGAPAVAFELTESGAPKMGAFTDKYKARKDEGRPGRQMAIVLDDRVMSCAEIQSRIDNRGQIHGRFTQEEVAAIVTILDSGSIPAPLAREPSTVTQIDPTLGADSIRNGAMAIAVSLAAVLLFTTVYYRFSGLVACFALLFNLIITLAIMILFGAPFTMPGLAGMVLTVGMSVDSNVLIFERMREEMERGAGLRMAIRNGFDRAFVTILDSNLTTLLTAAVLYFIGTDQLVGFAVTLILGILSSMFTAIFCARVIFDIAERNGWIKDLSMLKFMTKTHFDFIKWQWVAIIGSSVLIGLGILAGIARGPGLWDIDFRGGTAVDIALKKPMDYAEVRAKISKGFENKIDPETKTPYDWEVSRVNLAAGEAPPGLRYKVATSMKTDTELEALLAEAFRDGEGSYLRKFKVTYEPLTKNASPSTDAQGAWDEEGRSESRGPYFTAWRQDAAEEEPKSQEEPATEDSKTDDGKAATEIEEPGAKADEGDSKAAPPAPPADNEKATDEESAPEKATPEKSSPGKNSKGGPGGEGGASDSSETTSSATGTESTSTVLEINDDTGKGDGVDRDALLTMIAAAATEALKETVNAEVEPVGALTEGRALKWKVTLPLDAAKGEKVLTALQKSQEEQFIWPSSSTIGPQVAGNTKQFAVIAVAISLVGIVAYVWFRFHQISWGIAAVVALVHDVLFMFAAVAASSYLTKIGMGYLGVEDFKINLTIVAAFLTLIGYSINDTIVIFDRLREVKGRLPDVNREIVNDSINQTLSRTLLTFLTTFMVVVILYVFGGQGIHGFAFAMLVGTAVGCYSTVYIASPVLLALVNRPSKRTA
jgi:SecD/SecF fusion protein